MFPSFHTFATRPRLAHSFFVAVMLIALNSVSSAAFSSTTTPLAAHWAWPGQNATVSGKVHFTVNGAYMKTVKLYVGSTVVLTAAVSADGTQASGDVDTTKFANGTVTFTGLAWDSNANSVSLVALALQVKNSTSTSTSSPTYSRSTPMLGVYCGNSVSNVQQFETWLGRNASGVLGFTGNADWNDFNNSIAWLESMWSHIDRRVFWSIPLFPKNGATLEDAAAGSYNNHYLAAAQMLASFRPSDEHIYIRTGWEFNGNWYHWSAIGKPTTYIQAYRQFVNTFRSVSRRFVFEWNVNMDGGMNPEDAYPGDAYVDIIGMDFYWNTAWDPTDPIAAWNSKLNKKNGLIWHQNFAAQHNKATAYSEWGVMSDAAGPYIAKAQEWFAAHRVVYQTYWNSNSTFNGMLSTSQYPQAGAAYKDTFN